MTSMVLREAVFLTPLGPVVILVMGGVVLLIVLAIWLPIIEINRLCIDPILWRQPEAKKTGPEESRHDRAWCFRCSSKGGRMINT